MSTTAPQGESEQPHSSQLPSPSGLSESQATPQRPRSLAYPQGKNPYGRILDKVEHQYKRTATRPPSQQGSSIDGRPRTSGPFTFKTRPGPSSEPKHEQKAGAATPPPPPPPIKQPQRLISVKEARSFFETKASKARKVPEASPRKPALTVKTAVSDQKEEYLKTSLDSRRPPRNEHTPQKPTPWQKPPMERNDSDPALPIPKPPEQVEQVGCADRKNPFTRAKPATAGPPIVVRAPPSSEDSEQAKTSHEEQSPRREVEVADKWTEVVKDRRNTAELAAKATTDSREAVRRSEEVGEGTREATDVAAKHPSHSNPESPTVEAAPTPRRKSTNVFTELERAEHPLDGVQRAIAQHKQQGGPPEAVVTAAGGLESSPQTAAPTAPVSRFPFRKCQFTAETDGTTAPPPPTRTQEAESLRADYSVRRPTTDRRDRKASTGRRETEGNRRERGWGSAVEREVEADTTTGRAGRRALRRVAPERERDAGELARRSRRQYATLRSGNRNGCLETYVQLQEPLGQKGPYDLPTQRPAANSFRSNHDYVRNISAPATVPTHSDTRMKRRSTIRRSQTPLQDPGNWIKRICGHFSTVSPIEPCEDASKRVCSQCSVKVAARESQAQHCHTRKRAATDSSTSISTSTSTSSERGNTHPRKRRQRHSECAPTDKCPDGFVQDLGYIIDSILEEHSNTLQHVIDNIKFSRPNLAQLRRVSENLVQVCQSGGIRTTPCPCIFKQSRAHVHACRHVRQPFYSCRSHQPIQEVCAWRPICPCVLPNAVERLNVGDPGQVVPNLNDSQASLRESVKSTPQLVDLVKSAADDLGIDLDLRPTADDEAKFWDAPVEGLPQASVISRPSTALEPLKEKLDEERRGDEDAWLQRTRQQLNELSEARSQLMDELDTIAKDLGVYIDESWRSSQHIESIQRALSKKLTEESSRLPKVSVDSVTDSTPTILEPQIDETRLSRALPESKTKWRRISTIPRKHGDIESASLEEVQEWLGTAQAELPAAIDSITNVRETLSMTGFSEADAKEHMGQPGYEAGIQYDDKRDYDDYEVPDYYSMISPDDLYGQLGEPVVNVKDRVGHTERRLGGQFDRAELGAYSEKSPSPRIEGGVSESADLRRPGVRLAENGLRDIKAVERVVTRTTKIPVLRKKATEAKVEDVGSSSLICSQQSAGPQSDAMVEDQPLPPSRLATKLPTRVASQRPTIRVLEPEESPSLFEEAVENFEEMEKSPPTDVTKPRPESVLELWIGGERFPHRYVEKATGMEPIDDYPVPVEHLSSPSSA